MRNYLMAVAILNGFVLAVVGLITLIIWIGSLDLGPIRTALAIMMPIMFIVAIPIAIVMNEESKGRK